MKKRGTAMLVQQPPQVTGLGARVALLERNTRLTVPLRHTFVQRPQGEHPRHGPLKTFVTCGDLRALRAYLITVAASGAERDGDGWVTEFDSLVWARLLDAEQSATQASARA